ncbi:hypothetical protein [Marinobacter salarius]|uniref:Uncharacterized protein n=1 Tax=Marinobacter salarius TaxID=1420917 RepID=A0A1W6K990_9GAMM|nr:hypothetical protein [Marinobacter salarius]ARM83988.1 hypothetical protein MARSALSMR5_01910 [Marinobacter salarius]
MTTEAEPVTEPVTDPATTEPTNEPAAEPASEPTEPAKGNLLDGDGGDPSEPAAAPQDWPDDWRTKLAGGDEKTLKKLERFSSVNDVVKWAQNLEKKMSSGEFKQALDENATEEEVKQWREQNGIPEGPDGYDLDVDGLVVGDDDKPFLDEFLKEAHESNMPNEMVQKVVAWHYQNIEQQKEAMAEADADFQAEAQQFLREEWGGEYKQNINQIKNLLSTAPEGIEERLLGGRTADGKVVGNDPETLKWLSGLARQINPVATVVPGAGANQASAVQDEISSIETTMRTEPDKYWKDPKMQARYNELLQAQERLS